MNTRNIRHVVGLKAIVESYKLEEAFVSCFFAFFCASVEGMEEGGFHPPGLDVAKIVVFARENLVAVVLGALGVGLLGVGLWQYVAPSEPSVEIVSGGRDEEQVVGEIVVDVSGSVEQPGVYRLSSEARIGEALTAAGGLASSADRVWVSRFVNLAAPVTDGMKIYIPAAGEDTGGMVAGSSQVVGGGDVIGSQAGSGSININTASASELDTLWGIGPSRAQDIISNRPYGSVEELLTKAGIPKNVYERIRDEVTVY